MNSAVTLLLILTASFLCAPAAMSEGRQFKTLPETASPDGAYVFAYGPAAPAGKLEAFTFKMNPAGGKVQFELLKSVPLMEGEISASDLESEMTTAFNNLKATLDQGRHMTLQEDQLAWLKKRSGIANNAEKASATLKRIKDLRARLIEP